jgi:hypothetical protein
MRLVVQINAKDHAKALALMVRHSPGTALPNRTYIIMEEAARALREAGIGFTEISRDPDAPLAEGAAQGERI